MVSVAWITAGRGGRGVLLHPRLMRIHSGRANSAMRLNRRCANSPRPPWHTWLVTLVPCIADNLDQVSGCNGRGD
jgi:hypothetical protein